MPFLDDEDEIEPIRISSPEREAALEKQLYADHLEEQRLERRERIATAAMKGLLSGAWGDEPNDGQLVAWSMRLADLMIAALDEAKP